VCKLCDEGKPQNHYGSRRDFLKAVAATGVAAAGSSLFDPRPAAAHDDDDGPPEDHGHRGRRYIIRGGAVMTMDPSMPNKGEFAKADVLVEGKKIMAVGPNLPVAGATHLFTERLDELQAAGERAVGWVLGTSGGSRVL